MLDAKNYTAYVSFGENICRGTSSVPDDGFNWQATRPPIVLSAWQVTPGRAEGKYSTVMKWESYDGGEFAGVQYKMKSDAFLPYMDLPQKTDVKLELVASGGSTPTSKLSNYGWSLQDPLKITKDLWTYQHYIAESKAEFSVAKHGYVVSHSGWLSDRSGAYLASGRPVLVQETGFSDWLETGAGLLAFSSPDEALAGLEEINSHYKFHCKAAREISEEYFDARKILTRLIELSFQSQEASQADAGISHTPV
jgi:hypothetical protein